MKLKLNLLIPILDNQNSTQKYSRAYLNLKNVLELEKKAKYKFKDKSIYSDFEILEKQFNDFISGVPLVVIERYFNDNKENTNKYIYLEYEDSEVNDLKIMELFNKLEEFYQKCFTLACSIGNLYNFEIKYNSDDDNDNSELF